MPRRKIADLSDKIEADQINDDQNVDIAFVPNEDESSDSDNATESDTEEEILSRLLPAGHYEQIKSYYTSTQKLLEPNHKYEWRENVSSHDDLPDTDAYPFDPSSVLELQSKNSLELFELFFQNIWFQQDGAAAHHGREVRAYLDTHIHPHRWIGRRGEIEWPARRPDLMPLDYLLWGYLKSKVYSTQPQSLDKLQNRILQEATLINREMIRNAVTHFHNRIAFCQEAQGFQFEHLH